MAKVMVMKKIKLDHVKELMLEDNRIHMMDQELEVEEERGELSEVIEELIQGEFIEGVIQEKKKEVIEGVIQEERPIEEEVIERLIEEILKGNIKSQKWFYDDNILYLQAYPNIHTQSLSDAYIHYKAYTGGSELVYFILSYVSSYYLTYIMFLYL
jgi:hypothetical protein